MATLALDVGLLRTIHLDTYWPLDALDVVWAPDSFFLVSRCQTNKIRKSSFICTYRRHTTDLIFSLGRTTNQLQRRLGFLPPKDTLKR